MAPRQESKNSTARRKKFAANDKKRKAGDKKRKNMSRTDGRTGGTEDQIGRKFETNYSGPSKTSKINQYQSATTYNHGPNRAASKSPKKPKAPKMATSFKRKKK